MARFRITKEGFCVGMTEVPVGGIYECNDHNLEHYIREGWGVDADAEEEEKPKPKRATRKKSEYQTTDMTPE